MRILLVEDDEMIGTDLVKAMSAAGFSVDWVQDGSAGIDVLQAARTGDRTPVLIRFLHRTC